MPRFGRSRPAGGKDALDGLVRVFMLPYSKHLPARPSESFIGVHVSCSVGVDLPEPPFRVGFGDAPVGRTAMPETAVQEHGDSRPEEHEVDAALRPWHHLSMQPVSTTAPEQGPTNGHFERSVLLSNPLHPLADAWTGHRFRGMERISGHPISSFTVKRSPALIRSIWASRSSKKPGSKRNPEALARPRNPLAAFTERGVNG